MFRGLAVLAVCLPTATAVAEPGPTGVAYGVVGAELGTVATIAIHTYTASSPARGIGLAVNFLPVAVGVGTGILGHTLDLDPRGPLGFHGGVVGGLSLMAIGASFDGRDEPNGVKLGPAAITLGALGAAGGAYLTATRIETFNEAIAVATTPFACALGGGITFAIVHFFDDEGPKSDGRLLRYAGAGMLLGTIGSLIYAYPDRGGSTSARVAPSVSRDANATLVSFGGSF